MISLQARPDPEQFNVWDISVIDPTLHHTECMTFGVTFNEQFQPCWFSASVCNFGSSFWQRANGVNRDDLYNPEAFDDSWQIGCDSDMLREEKWPALKKLVHRFLHHLGQHLGDNPLLFPWIQHVTSINGVELDIQLCNGEDKEEA